MTPPGGPSRRVESSIAGALYPELPERFPILPQGSNSAHPGEAPVSPENLASFYSDLKLMVFDSPKFKV